MSSDLERLAEKGWGEEISSHRKEYVKRPSFVHGPNGYNDESSWNCLHCWRDDPEVYWSPLYEATVPQIKKRVTDV